MDFDYKKYSLENLENWLHDAMYSGEATPEEVYNTIKSVVEEQYYHHKYHTGQAYELLALLNGNGANYYTDPKGNKVSSYTSYHYYNNVMPSSTQRDIDSKKDKVVKWQLPVQVDGLTGDCFVEFPDDLLEAANLKEGDQVEWVDNGNGTYTLRHVTMSNTLNMDEC